MPEASRRLGVARGTVQAHLERMQERGVITGYGPNVDPAALGHEVTAFNTLEIRQATATIRSPNGSTHRARIVGSLPPSLVLPRALAGRCRARSAAVPRATESPSRESEVSLTREQPG